MKIVIAPDSFKESLSATEVAAAIEIGFKQIFPEAQYCQLPMADGGEGSIDVIQAASGGDFVSVPVKDALMRNIQASYLISADGQTAYIEMARASGIELITPEERQPGIASTYGTGQLIRDALQHQVKKVVVFIGGSATNDGGAGMAQALGVQLLDARHHELPVGCVALSSLADIDVTGLMPEVLQTEFEVACDVDNSLLGPLGATTVFGPQKGVTSKTLPVLESALAHYTLVVNRTFDCDISQLKGGGAAGGLGAGLSVFCHASLRRGFDLVSDAVKFPERLANADLVVTGEGRLDAQSIMGKVPTGVGKLARERGIATVAIAGSLAEPIDVVYQHGLDAVFAVVNRPCDLPQALAEGKNNIITTSRNIAALINIKLKY